jgi:hypothetical protein
MGAKAQPRLNKGVAIPPSGGAEPIQYTTAVNALVAPSIHNVAKAYPAGEFSVRWPCRKVVEHQYLPFDSDRSLSLSPIASERNFLFSQVHQKPALQHRKLVASAACLHGAKGGKRSAVPGTHCFKGAGECILVG